MTCSTIKLFNNVSKNGFTFVDFDTQKSIFYQFQRYAVRRSIAENNAILSSIFKMQGDYSTYFNAFNSAFIGNYNMINLLRDGELKALPKMSNEKFERLLNDAKFDRQIALICFSLRNNERIPNRVDYPILISYANMQDRVIDYFKGGTYLVNAIDMAGDDTRNEFMNKYGCPMNFEYRTYANGEKYMSDRSVTEKIGYSGTLTARQVKAYEEFIKTVLSHLFEDKNQDERSEVIKILVQKVIKSHGDDTNIEPTKLAFEIVYRFLMPTNDLKEKFLTKVKNMEDSIDSYIQSRINIATSQYNQEANSDDSELERLKSESYKNEIYKRELKKIVEQSLKENVGLHLNSSKKNTIENSVPPAQYGE